MFVEPKNTFLFTLLCVAGGELNLNRSNQHLSLAFTLLSLVNLNLSCRFLVG